MSALPAWTARVHSTFEPCSRPETAGRTPACDADAPEQLWRLLVDSGYFHLAGRSVEEFASRQDSFLELSRRTPHLPEILKQTGWHSERGLEATLSIMKPYRATWLVHQLARRQGGARFESVPGQMLKDLYVHSVAHAQRDPSFRWLASYVESTVPFVQRTHMGFGRRVVREGQGLLLPLRMRDIPSGAAPHACPSGWTLHPPTPRERAAFGEHLTRTRPGCYVEALDLGPNSLGFDEAARPWRAAGLARERHLVLARRGDTPLAMAVMELGPRGANPFQLLDTTRLFAWGDTGRDAFPALLNEARRWYASRGRESFVFLVETDGDDTAAGLPDDGSEARPYLWLIPAHRAADFLQHLHEQTGSRLPPSHEKEPS
ncbi:hypothetical protein A176_000660 [Myxococcus hansupus]|uniref:Uncharacterized protein n=1 Tax=Pseudomyxococcus hansupus TaxID=1297742 RepID=A0A0H4WQ76_9BACT|nr:hypothetical protein [Myxococcus hansupus]AKQ63748.1 hypothetical protein A176_000660 [Myxococcus hansupus]